MSVDTYAKIYFGRTVSTVPSSSYTSFYIAGAGETSYDTFWGCY